MAIVYILAGAVHFVYPKAYLRIMPLWIPARKFLVYLSGLAEIILGIALFFPETRNWAIYGIVLMLFLFLLVHVNMLRNEKTKAGFPVWALLLRLPLQFGLMWWALIYLNT